MSKTDVKMNNLYSAAISRKHLNVALSQSTSVSREQDRLLMRRKTPLLTAGSRSSTVRQAVYSRRSRGLPTEKVRRPSVLRRYRGTIKRCRTDSDTKD